MQRRILPAIMSGGAGTRLWPASTEAKPKQFHALAGAGTLIQETARRLSGASGDLVFEAPIILANAAHADLVETQLNEIGIAPLAIALEPFGKNTAAAGAIAAALGRELAPGALVLLVPADHVIGDVTAFHDAIARAAAHAETHIVTFGIKPDRPETGYGYIKRGETMSEHVFAIDSFKEKPDAETARAYLSTGDYAWNSGMFLFDPDVLLAEFEKAADIRDATLAALAAATRIGARILIDAEKFAAVRAAPIDIAVMEATLLGAVAPVDIGWADLGAWDEIWRLADKDSAGNVRIGPVVTLDARNNLLRSDGITLAVAGIEDLIVVAEGDTILIAPRARAQDVKKLLEAAKGKRG